MAKRAQGARPPSRGRHARATRFASPPRGLHSPNQTASAERLPSRRAQLEAKGLTVLSEQTIYYDDIVVATQPIGCGKF